LAPLLAGNQENRIALTNGEAKRQPLSLGLWTILVLREKQNATASAQPLFRVLLTDDVGGYQPRSARCQLTMHAYLTAESCRNLPGHAQLSICHYTCFHHPTIRGTADLRRSPHCQSLIGLFETNLNPHHGLGTALKRRLKLKTLHQCMHREKVCSRSSFKVRTTRPAAERLVRT
jgi:hypothetical protein